MQGQIKWLTMSQTLSYQDFKKIYQENVIKPRRSQVQESRRVSRLSDWLQIAFADSENMESVPMDRLFKNK